MAQEDIKKNLLVIEENRRRVKEKINARQYDVFLSYNHKEEKLVKDINKQLIDNGIAPLFDRSELEPGLPWCREIKHQLSKVEAAAIFLGASGFGSVQQEEMQMIEEESKRRDGNMRVIPVFLSNALLDARFPDPLPVNTWVDFREKNFHALKQLIWGITNEKREKIYLPGVLIASLGDSPVIVSSMYDLLTKREGLSIDRIDILMPQDEQNSDIENSYKLIEEAFMHEPPPHLKPERLNFKDADTWSNTCIFLQNLYKKLNVYEQLGESVYLSLAGGRKSMAALMAWVVPFFPCIQRLYHVIDRKEEKFLPVCQIKYDYSESQYYKLMHPNIDQLDLVDIPLNMERQTASLNLHKRLDSASRADFDVAEAIITEQTIAQESCPLKVEITNLVIKQFHELRDKDKYQARVVRNALLAMGQLETLRRDVEHENQSNNLKSMRQMPLHYLTGLQVPVQPVFYTRPEDINANPDSQVRYVIICSLETPGVNGYKMLEEVEKKTPGFSREASSVVDVLPPVPFPADSILIVPMGKSPMVATQLYTLLTENEMRTIHEVILLYPELSQDIRNAVKIVKEALGRKGVLCHPIGIPDLEDITSSEACRRYQEKLEEEIKRVREKYPDDYKIDLALSGGRKGMTAMTIFAAQKLGIPYLYHTLITDDDLAQKIEEETAVSVLKNQVSDLNLGLDDEGRDNLLFLKEYKDEAYNRFVLFKVPVFTAEAW